MVHENATNAFVETKKIKKEFLEEVKQILKQKINIEQKQRKINKYLKSTGFKFSYRENVLLINSGGDYSTTYEFNL